MEQRRLKYPIGVQNFEKLRNAGQCYVDKTGLMWEMVQDLNYVFLSRPRRFGKSLLVSTLEAYFEGRRELFEGLAIAQLETEWRKYPIFHLDLNAKQYRQRDDLIKILNMHLERWEKIYGDEFKDRDPEERFTHLIEKAYEQTGSQVVILVDEYDKPMALNLADDELQEEYRCILKAFYGVMKSSDRYIRFGFLTGVTKFSKVSVFSDLNNLDDISMWDKYVSICGITEQEIRDNFDHEVETLAVSNHMTKADCYSELRRRYDGYHFCEDALGIYNPFSLLHTLVKQKFGDYWFETGTPTQLVELLKRANYNLNDLVDGEVSGQVLGSVDSIKKNPVSVIYQSGYLTIKGYDKRFDEYRLGFPNDEVENGFTSFLLPFYSNQKDNPTEFSIVRFVKEIEGGQVEAFMSRLVAMMADTDYRIVGSAELYLLNFLFVFFRLLGLYVEVERATSDGRMDMVVKTSEYIYIIEFKIDRSADEALKQIEDKGYARPFAVDKRTLYKVGVNFNSAKRSVDDWKVLQDNNN